MERLSAGLLFDGVSGAGWDQLNMGRLVDALGEVVVDGATGPADVVKRYRHGLGRIPRGVILLNAERGSGTGAVGWYRVSGDGDWTATEVVLRWDVADLNVAFLVL